MNLFIVVFVAFLSIFTAKPAAKTEVYLEKGGQLIAFQASGDEGKVKFKYLDQGSYKLLLVFPQQEGKLIKEKPKHYTMTSHLQSKVENLLVSRQGRILCRKVFRNLKGIQRKLYSDI